MPTARLVVEQHFEDDHAALSGDLYRWAVEAAGTCGIPAKHVGYLLLADDREAASAALDDAIAAEDRR